MEVINSIIRYCNPADTGFRSCEKFGRMSTLEKCCAVAAAIFGAIIGLGFGGIAAFRLTVEYFTKELSRTPTQTPEPPPSIDNTPTLAEERVTEDHFDLENIVSKDISLGERLGSGGFSSIHIPCVDGVAQPMLVVKKASSVLGGSNDEAITQIRNECTLLADLNPNNDVIGIQKRVWEVNVDGAVCHLGPRYTMDLRKAQDDTSLKTRDNMQQIAFQLASGLHYLHSKEVIHGDIILGNIFLDYVQGTSFRAYLADVGGARKALTSIDDLRAPMSVYRISPEDWGKIDRVQNQALMNTDDNTVKSVCSSVNKLLKSVDERALYCALYTFIYPRSSMLNRDQSASVDFHNMFTLEVRTVIVNRINTLIDETETLSCIISAMKSNPNAEVLGGG